MYDNINLSELQLNAADFVKKNDRALYYKYYEAIETYLSANLSCFIGGSAANILVSTAAATISSQAISHQRGADLPGLPIDLNIYEIYGKNIREHAMNLLKIFYEIKNAHINNALIMCEENSVDAEYTLIVNTRQVAKLYILDNYRSVDFADLIVPYAAKGFFGPQINCLPEEILLINIYRTLYSPFKQKLFAEYFNYHLQMIGKVAKEIPIQIAAASSQNKLPSDYVIEKFLEMTSEHAAIIGDFALSRLGLISDPKRLQYIIAEPIEDFLAARLPIAKSAHKSVTGLNFVKFFIAIPSDFQITKYTIYMQRGSGADVPVADVYNSASFELVQKYHNSKYPIGSLFVLMRFKLIDLWMMKLVNKLTGRTDDYSRIYAQINALKYKIAATEIDDLFCINHFGSHISENVARKKQKKRYGGYKYAKLLFGENKDRPLGIASNFATSSGKK